MHIVQIDPYIRKIAKDLTQEEILQEWIDTEILLRAARDERKMLQERVDSLNDAYQILIQEKRDEAR